MSDGTKSPITLSAPSVDVPIPEEEESTINTCPQVRVSDTGLPGTPNSEISSAESEQHHSPLDVAVAFTRNTDTSAATPASSQFTVMLGDETPSTNAKHFALVSCPLSRRNSFKY
jgi:hypothetical protein